MAYGLYLSAAGANAQSHRLEVLSHNLANINTTGFKPHMSMLQSQHAEAIEQGDAVAGSGNIDDVGGGIQIKAPVTMFEQGSIRHTGNKTDFALVDNDSFFAVQRGDRQLLTRAGNFMFDSTGTLVSQHGDPVLSAGGGRITIDPNRPYEVMDDGAVVQDGGRQTVGVMRPASLGDLARVGDNLFESLTPLQNTPDAARNIMRGSLEMSAVEPTKAMMELIEASRLYEANVKLIQTQDDSRGQLISRVLKG
ncbi:MAG: flagellar hook basal-body protein [Aureliella sp.]